MADNNINTTFQYDANFAPLLAQLKSLIGQVNALNAQFNSLDANSVRTQKALAQTFLGQVGAVGGFKSSVVDLTTQTDKFGQALTRNKLTMREYFQESKNAFKQNSNAMRLAQQQVRVLQSQMVQIGKGQAAVFTPAALNLKDYNTQLQMSAQRWSIFNKLVSDGATSLINFGKNTQWAGRQLMVGLTLPLTVFGAAVSKTFREVDAELTRFAKVYGSDLVDANGNATEQMKGQILDLAKTYASTYGVAAKETAALAADIAATGLEGAELVGAVAQTTRLAVLGEVDRQDAMKTTLALQSSFKQNTEELTESINFLNAVENQTSTTLQDFTEAIPKAGPVVRGLGGDIKDLALMLTAMREGGIPAAEAANAIKSGMASLINPTRQAREQLMGFGIDIDGIVKANRGELIPTVMAFKEALDGVDEFTRSQAIETVFGKYQFARMGALFDNIGESGSQTQKVMELMGASTKELGQIADGEIKTLTESTSMRFQRAMEGIKAALIPVGEAITSTVIPFMTQFSDIINNIVDGFNNLPGPVQKFLKLFTGFTVIAGPIIMLVGLLSNFAGYIVKGAMSFTNLGRRMLGLPVQKFELLTAELMAANTATDTLTVSYTEQAVALSRLNAELARYGASLRATTMVNPGMLIGRGKNPKKLATGGVVRGPGTGTSDSIPAMLSNGESVIPAKQTKKYGGLINGIIDGNIPGFAKGLRPPKTAPVVDFEGKSYPTKTIQSAQAVQDILDAMEFNPETGMYTYINPSGKRSSRTREQVLGILDRRASKGNVTESGILKGLDRERGGRGSGKSSDPYKPARYKEEAAKIFEGEFEHVRKKTGIENNSAYQIHSSHINPDIDPATGMKRWDDQANIAPDAGYMNLFMEANKKTFAELLKKSDAELKALGIDRSELKKLASGIHPTTLKGARTMAAIGSFTGTPLGKMVSAAVKYRESTGFYKGGMKTKADLLTRLGLAMSSKKRGAAGRTAGRLKKDTMVPMPAGVTPVGVHEGEIIIPAALAEEGAEIKDGKVSKLKRMAGSQAVSKAGSMGINAAFMLPALGIVDERLANTANKLSILALAVSAASMSLKAVAGLGGKAGMLANVGQKVGLQGALLKGGGKTAVGRGMGQAMLMGGRMLTALSGPIGLAVAAIGVSLALLVKNIKDTNKEMTAAFATGTESAKVFGIQLNSLREAWDSFGNEVEDTTALDQAAKSDFGTLIGKLKDMTSKTEIQNEFKTFYASLISQGFTAEQAQNLVSSVARQAEKEPILLSVTAELKAIKTPGDVVKQLQAGVMASLDDSKGFFGAFDSLFSQDQGKALGIGVEALMKAYDSAPIETMQAFSDIIAKVKADGTGFFASSVADGIDDYADSIKETNPVLAEAILKADGFENKLKMIIATQAGMDLSNVTDQLLDFAIKADAASNAATAMQNALRADLDESKKALEENHRSYITAKEDEIIADEKAIKKRQEATKKQLEGIQNEIDKREKTIDAAQEKIDAIEKERDVVNEFYDGQLDALDAINKKEEYNAQQRQTMYDALGALSRGDIQGFMAARETMAGNAGANVREQAKDMLTTRQENANKVLNARRDEQEAIIDQEQKMIKLRREQMETIQKATEKFIEGKQKEIEKTQELMRTEQRRFSAANRAIDDLYAKDPSEWTQENLNAINTAVQKHTSQVAKTVGTSLKNASATIPKAFTQYYENAAKAAGLSSAELKNFLDLKKALGQKNVKIEKGDALYKLLNNMGLGNLANTAGLADLKKLTGTMHTGGYVGGNDPEPLKTLERGEFVLNKDAVNRIGRGRLEAMNSGTGGELSPFNATAGIPQAVHNKNEVGTNSAVSLLRTQQLPMDILRMKALNIAAGQNVDYGSPSSSGFIKPPGAITSPYGMRIHPVTKENKMHSGIDFGMQPGDAVPSIGPGKVISSGFGTDVGGKVLVRHPGGFDSEYYHMSPNGLASGNVNAGSTLGRVGNASEMGRLSTGPHLHLGMMKDGNYVDPKNYLPLRQGGIVKNDGTPAMLHRGEMVLPAPTTRELMGPQYSVPQPSGDQGMVSVTTVGGDKTTINVTINSNQNPNAIASQVIARINDTIKSRRVGRS